MKVSDGLSISLLLPSSDHDKDGFDRNLPTTASSTPSIRSTPFSIADLSPAASVVDLKLLLLIFFFFPDLDLALT
jgi:hypothetical protein